MKKSVGQDNKMVFRDDSILSLGDKTPAHFALSLEIKSS